jgi:hypothetical protein
VSEQTHSYGEAQKCSGAESNKMNQADQDSRRGRRKEKTEHLQTRAIVEIAVKKNANQYRESDPANTANN